ncbi:MAG: MFS transporter [Actinobacteria bacterium]|nr:MFS transporter [Actinomycetota bacterium]
MRLNDFMTPSPHPKPPLRATISWIFYDFANTAYSMNIVSLYFGTWIIIELSQRDAYVSIANSLSMILVALTMPILGDFSDFKGKKLPSLFIFTMSSIAGIILMGVLGYYISNVSVLMPAILVLFVITNYSYQGGLVFYNALMPSVSTTKTIGRVSGYGVAFGYLGAIVGLAVAGVFVDGELFGVKLAGVSSGGARAAFFPTAVLFFIFAIPIFFFVKESRTKEQKEKKWNIKDSYIKVRQTIVETNRYPGLLRFLIAKLLYEDSIQTVIIFMGVYTQAVMGFTRAEANQFFTIVIPSAIIGSAFCGILSDHYGPKKTLFWVIFLWIASLAAVIMTSNRALFWVLGGVIGALMGSTWTSARPLLISLVPKENLGEFFGLYSLSGKLAAVVGPLVWSAVTFSLEKYGDVVKFKAAIGAMAILMIAGLLTLRAVPDFHKKIKATMRK